MHASPSTGGIADVPDTVTSAEMPEEVPPISIANEREFIIGVGVRSPDRPWDDWEL